MPRIPVVPPVPALALTTLLVLAGPSLGGWASAQTTPALALPAQTNAAQFSGFQGVTVTVQAKDTAYGIARRAGLSVEALLALNGLSSPDLKTGQTLRVSNTAQHVVGPKETLYALSRRYGVSVNALLAENTLPEGAVLSVGQVLRLPANATLPTAAAAITTASVNSSPAALAPAPGPLAVTPVLSVSALTPPPTLSAPPPPEALPSGTADNTPVSAAGPFGPALPPAAQLPAPEAALPGDWRGAAMALLGTPYRYGGTTRAGLDCSGFVLQVFAPLGVRLPRVSADQARVGLPVAASELQPGDLVFFDTAGGGRISHVGIYLGGDTFVSANSYQGKVSVDTLLADRYWAPRYRGARRVLGTYAGQTP